jgi:hypothetical protein
MFIHFSNQILNSDTIRWIECTNLVRSGYIRLYLQDGSSELVEGPEAFNVVMTLCPGALEGKRAKYAKRAWAIHNLIGHPLMQLCSMLHLTSLGIKIHDATVPLPKIIDE